MCTLHAPCDMKFFRTLHSRPATRFARKPRRKNVLQLFGLARTHEFSFELMETFFCGALCPEVSGQAGLNREFRHARASTPAKLTEHLQVLVSSRLRSRSVVSALIPSLSILVLFAREFLFWNGRLGLRAGFL